MSFSEQIQTFALSSISSSNSGAGDKGQPQTMRKFFQAVTPLLLSLGLGSILQSSAQNIFQYIWKRFTHSTYSTIIINNTDDLFKMVLKYLIKNNLLKQDLNHLEASEVEQNKKWWEIKDEKEKNEIDYMPTPGLHSFKFEDITIYLNLDEGKDLSVGWEQKKMKQKTISLYCKGKSSQAIQNLIQKAIEDVNEDEKGKIRIYEYSWYWREIQTKKARDLSSVVLDGEISDTIVKDIEKFQSSEKWYKERGVPYRRGYLLYGPPGTGKTSFTEAVAGRLNLNICYLNLSSSNLNDTYLNRALLKAPLNSIILLEDIDALFIERESVESKQRITFSGFLNALDGIRAQEGRILFMSTNHIEKLDPALLRPGRADVKVELNNASSSQMKNLYLRFFPEEKEKALKFANQLPEKKISMAKLQGHFLKYRDSAEEAVTKARELIDETQLRDELSIGEWLDRLNMQKYIPKFHKNEIYRVSDLKYIENSGDLSKIKVSLSMDVKRIYGVLQGEQGYMQYYPYFTKHQCRNLIQKYLKDQDQIDNFVSLIPEKEMTGFQLLDIFDENFSVKDIEKGIKKRLEISHEIKKGTVHKKEIEDEKDKEKEKKEKEKEKKKKEKQYPSIIIEELFKECGLEDKIEKLKEVKVFEPQLFWELSEANFENLIGIKVYGKRKKFMKRFEKIKKDFEDNLFKEEKEKELLESSTFQLIRQASSFK